MMYLTTNHGNMEYGKVLFFMSVLKSAGIYSKRKATVHFAETVTFSLIEL